MYQPQSGSLRGVGRGRRHRLVYCGLRSSDRPRTTSTQQKAPEILPCVRDCRTRVREKRCTFPPQNRAELVKDEEVTVLASKGLYSGARNRQISGFFFLSVMLSELEIKGNENRRKRTGGVLTVQQKAWGRGWWGWGVTYSQPPPLDCECGEVFEAQRCEKTGYVDVSHGK